MIENRSRLCGYIIENRCVAPDHFLMSVRLPCSFATPLPGQFVMLRQNGRNEPLLARPLSVCGFQRQERQTVLELLFRVAGRGTQFFGRMKSGDELTVLGPLGRGFTVPDDIRRVVFVAGGVGVAPLIFLLHSRFLASADDNKPEAVFYLGARAAELLAGLERLKGFCELNLCTDDGSLGYRGPVTDLLKRDIGGYGAKDTVIYACGPKAMIVALSHLVGNLSMRCQVSLEERMACGLGACLGCAVAIRSPDLTPQYRRVCHEGPVFDLQEVILTSSLDGT